MRVGRCGVAASWQDKTRWRQLNCKHHMLHSLLFCAIVAHPVLNSSSVMLWL